MRAIILAAGEGKRLRPASGPIPKCMVPYRGRPLLHYQLDCLRSAGIDDIVVVTGFMREMVEAPGCRLVVNTDFATTNMVETLMRAREHLDTDVVISYGDIIYEKRILDLLLGTRHELAVAVSTDWLELWRKRMDDPLEDAETLRMSPEDRLLEIGERPSSYEDIEGQYMGLIRLSQSGVANLLGLYDSLDRSVLYDGRLFEQMYMTRLLQLSIGAGLEVHGVRVAGEWLEVDTPRDLLIPCRVADEYPGVVGG